MLQEIYTAEIYSGQVELKFGIISRELVKYNERYDKLAIILLTASLAGFDCMILEYDRFKTVSNGF